MTDKHDDAVISSGIHGCGAIVRLPARCGNRAEETSRQEHQRVDLLCLPRSIRFGTTMGEGEICKDVCGYLYPSG